MQITAKNISKYKNKVVILNDDGVLYDVKILGINNGWLRMFKIKTKSIVELLPDSEIKIFVKKDDYLKAHQQKSSCKG